MSYVEETPVAADAATTTTPALADVAKTVGGAIAEGAVLGLTSQFISEATDMVLSKALEAGMITPALAKSTMFKEGLKFCVPMMMMAAAEYPQCPKREFFSKVGALAVRGQSAQHAAMFTAVAMGYVSGMTALPSAALLSDRLSAAE